MPYHLPALYEFDRAGGRRLLPHYDRQGALVETFRVPSSDRPHVGKAEIEADRENLKDSVFRSKHGAEWLTDAGDSMISLEHVRALIESPPEHLPGRPVAFCDFAGPGGETVFTLANGT